MLHVLHVLCPRRQGRGWDATCHVRWLAGAVPARVVQARRASAPACLIAWAAGAAHTPAAHPPASLLPANCHHWASRWRRRSSCSSWKATAPPQPQAAAHRQPGRLQMWAPLPHHQAPQLRAGPQHNRRASRPTPCCCRSSTAAGSAPRCDRPSERLEAWIVCVCGAIMCVRVASRPVRLCAARDVYRPPPYTCARRSPAAGTINRPFHAPPHCTPPHPIALPCIGSTPSAAAWCCEWRAARPRSPPPPGPRRCW